MKKFFGCFVLCLLVSSAFGMKRLEPNRGFDDDYGLACKRRRMLSEGQQKELDRKLFEILGETKSKIFIDAVCARAKELLDQGADSNSYDVLWLAASKEGYSKIVSLLLAYGADPNLHDGAPDFAVPIVDACDLETIQVLVQNGADINACKPSSRKTLLKVLCGDDGAGNLPVLVWVLSHGGNPNIGPARDCKNKYACFAIHKALCSCSLEKVIALLQSKARLDVETDFFEKPLVYAESVLRRYQESGSAQVLVAQAQLELLRAVDVHNLDTRHVYTPSEYEVAGISRGGSAELIIAATKRVNEAFA